MLGLRRTDRDLAGAKYDEGMTTMCGIEVRMSGKSACALGVSDSEVRGKGSGVGPAIAAAREMQGLSKEQLAQALGIGPDELAQIEKGRREVSADILLKLARGLNMQTEITIDTARDHAMGVKFKKLKGEKK